MLGGSSVGIFNHGLITSKCQFIRNLKSSLKRISCHTDDIQLIVPPLDRNKWILFAAHGKQLCPAPGPIVTANKSHRHEGS